MKSIKKQIYLRPILWVILSLGLSACGSLLDTGQDTVADNIYDLNPLPASGSEADQISLYLEPPTYPAYLGTYKIAVKPGGQEIKYLSGAHWSDQVPSLIARFLRVSLENSGPFLINTSRQTPLPTEYKLTVDIRDFSTKIGPGDQPSAKVELDVSLIETKTLEVLATRNFSANVPAAENSKVAIAGAFQEAMEGIAGEMKNWILAEK